MCRCNNCMKVFSDDSQLEILEDVCFSIDGENNLEFYKGCPDCKTDAYLMDLDR